MNMKGKMKKKTELTNIELQLCEDGFWLIIKSEPQGMINLSKLDKESDGIPVFTEWAKDQFKDEPELLQEQAMKKPDVVIWHELFQTDQYGRFYVTNSKNAHSVEFRIQVLLKNEKAIPNGNHNLCLNKNAVLVFGPRWRKTKDQGKDGWLHEWFYDGPWIADFQKLVDELQQAKDEQNKKKDVAKIEAERAEKDRIAALLALY